MSMNENDLISNPEWDKNALDRERTRMAAERTFLAWIRTGLTSIGIGIALAKFIIFHTIIHEQIGKISGKLLILWGICIFCFALFSYRRICIQLHSGVFWKAYAGLTIATVFLIILSFILFWIVVD